VTSGFRRDADEICGLLGQNAASSGKQLPLDAALYPRRAQISEASVALSKSASFKKILHMTQQVNVTDTNKFIRIFFTQYVTEHA
jgi:hypothetical protein